MKAYPAAKGLPSIPDIKRGDHLSSGNEDKFNIIELKLTFLIKYGFEFNMEKIWKMSDYS